MRLYDASGQYKEHCDSSALTLFRSDLTVPQREEYIAAVLCLMKRPAQAPKDRFPGALNRFDDFVAFHMTNAKVLHDPVRQPRNLVFVLIVLRSTCLPAINTSSGPTNMPSEQSVVILAINLI